MQQDSEQAQADLFIAYLRYNKLDIPLRRHDWLAFADGYNGKDHALNNYAPRLANAFKRLGGK